MKFDINEVVAEMLGAIKGSVEDDWTAVKDTMNSFMNARKERLKLLAELRIDNEISQNFFEERLKDEEKIISAELHAIAIISKAAAQRAANAALEVLGKAVKVALKAI